MISRLALAAAMVAALGVTGAAAQEEKVVNVYNWSDYIDEDVLQQFTKETGIKVVYDVFDSNEILETKLLAGGTNYDVVVPTGLVPGPPDPGRRVPEARQGPDPEPQVPVEADRGAPVQVRSRQRATP